VEGLEVWAARKYPASSGPQGVKTPMPEVKPLKASVAMPLEALGSVGATPTLKFRGLKGEKGPWSCLWLPYYGPHPTPKFWPMRGFGSSWGNMAHPLGEVSFIVFFSLFCLLLPFDRLTAF